MLRKRRFPKTRHIIKHCKRSVERLKKNKNLIDKVISNNVIAEGSYKTYNKYHVANVMRTSSIFITVSLMMI